MDTTERKLKDLGDAAALYAYEYHKQLAINKDLLEALEATQKYICEHHCMRYESDQPVHHFAVCIHASSAIAKARGEGK